MSLTKEKILEIEHRLIRDCSLIEAPETDPQQIAMYIGGANDLAQAIIEEIDVQPAQCAYLS